MDEKKTNVQLFLEAYDTYRLPGETATAPVLRRWVPLVAGERQQATENLDDDDRSKLAGVIEVALDFERNHGLPWLSRLIEDRT